MSEHASILFVCLGNICRSPLARWIFQDLVARRGLQHRITIDSCGTGAWHIGQDADPRAAATARTKGLDPAHTARQICPEDFESFDLIVVMDRQNQRDVLALGAPPDKVRLMRSFDPASTGKALDVPDPYYGGDEGFEHVHKLLAIAAEGLLSEVERSLLS
jgi:protein-tyrosine phosphatase